MADWQNPEEDNLMASCTDWVVAHWQSLAAVASLLCLAAAGIAKFG